MVLMEVILMMYRRLDAIGERLRALDPGVLLGLVVLSCLWVIWTVYVWTENPFTR